MEIDHEQATLLLESAGLVAASDRHSTVAVSALATLYSHAVSIPKRTFARDICNAQAIE